MMSSILSKNTSVYSLGLASLKNTNNWSLDTNNFPENLICAVDKSVFLSKSEFLVRCVYDKNHRITNGKFGVHLDKCRRNYLVDLEKKGFPAEIARCGVNPEHWGYAPELAFHEHNCPDKCYLELESLYLKKAAFWEETYRCVQEEASYLADAPMNEIDEYLERFDDIKEAQYPEFPKLYEYFMELIKERPSPFQVQGLRYKMLKIDENLDALGPIKVEADPVRPKELFDQTKDPDAFGFIRRPVRYHKRSRYPKVKMPCIEEDPNNEDEMWVFDDTPGKPGYSWLQMQFHLDPTLRRCPPGLTRAERKAWEKIGTDRLMCEKGIFSQDELEAALKKHNDGEKLELEWNKME